MGAGIAAAGAVADAFMGGGCSGGLSCGMGVPAAPGGGALFSGLQANRARGLAYQARALKELDLAENVSTLVKTAEGSARPDALTATLLVEVKNTPYVSLTRQLRIETEAAREAGLQSVLVTNGKVSGPARNAFDLVVPFH